MELLHSEVGVLFERWGERGQQKSDQAQHPGHGRLLDFISSMMRSQGVGGGGGGLNSRTRQFDLHFKKEWLSKVFRCGLSRRKQPPVLPLLLSTWAGRQCNRTQYCTAVTSYDLSQMCSGGRKGEEDVVCMPTSNWAATQAPGFPVKCINYLCYF